MRKFNKNIVAGLLLAGSTAICASAESYNMTMVAGQPPIFRWVKMFDIAFAPEFEQKISALGHSVTFDPQWGGAVAGPGEELETVGAGLAEIGLCSPLFDPAKMPEQNVTYYAPFVSTDIHVVTKLMSDLHKSDANFQRAFDENNVVYLGAPVALDDYMLVTTFPVTSVDDLKGKKISAPGAAANWLSGTGAVAVAGNITTYYNSLSTGVYEGVLVFASAAFPGKLHEVAPYMTKIGLGAQVASNICANKDWYDALPADVQDALHSAAEAAEVWYLDQLEVAAQTALTKMQEAGATVTVASDEMRQDWVSNMDNAAQIWAKSLDDAGRPGTAVLSAYMEAARAAGATPLRDWDKE